MVMGLDPPAFQIITDLEIPDGKEERFYLSRTLYRGFLPDIPTIPVIIAHELVLTFLVPSSQA